MSSYDQQMQQMPQMQQPTQQPLTWGQWFQQNKTTIIIIIVIIIVVGGGWYWWSSKKSSASGSTGMETSPTSSAGVAQGGNGITITRMRGSYY
jgi:predicted negative regulator of RcsB-dependent stress response